MNWRSVALLLSIGASGFGMFMRPEWVPVDRLVTNTARYAESHPTDAAAHYALGRLHYLAFALKMEAVPAFPGGDEALARTVPDHLIGLPLAGAREQRAMELAREELGTKADDKDRQKFFQAVSRYRTKLEAENWMPQPPPTDVLLRHAQAAAIAFEKAMQLNPEDALTPLGLGSLLIQFADWNDDAHVSPVPDRFRGDLRREARGLFLKAWNRAYPTDSKAKMLPLGGLSEFVSFEAGHAFVKLAETDRQSLSPEETAALPKIKAGVAALEKLPIGAITPLVMSLHPRPRLRDMLLPGASVAFDLMGMHRSDRWGWIAPDLALICWDPGDRRAIRSGHQLFGTFAFQGIWRNGFEALRALDDNGDGELSGTELDGLALWHDRNGDGSSTRAEVAPVSEFGITALACDFCGEDDEHPVNWEGARLDDGRSVPLWDWLAQPANVSVPH